MKCGKSGRGAASWVPLLPVKVESMAVDKLSSDSRNGRRKGKLLRKNDLRKKGTHKLI